MFRSRGCLGGRGGKEELKCLTFHLLLALSVVLFCMWSLKKEGFCGSTGCSSLFTVPHSCSCQLSSFFLFVEPYTSVYLYFWKICILCVAQNETSTDMFLHNYIKVIITPSIKTSVCVSVHTYKTFTLDRNGTVMLSQWGQCPVTSSVIGSHEKVDHSPLSPVRHEIHICAVKYIISEPELSF